jgi:hypothetical protein
MDLEKPSAWRGAFSSTASRGSESVTTSGRITFVMAITCAVGGIAFVSSLSIASMCSRIEES